MCSRGLGELDAGEFSQQQQRRRRGKRRSCAGLFTSEATRWSLPRADLGDGRSMALDGESGFWNSGSQDTGDGGSPSSFEQRW
jgi:hypothetical protein